MMKRLTLLALVISALLLALSASAASAGYYGHTWLNWGYVGSQQITWTGYTHLKQVSTQPKTYNGGCGNMWAGTHYVFGTWYCGSPEYALSSPDLAGAGEWAEPVAWNDTCCGQLIWAWEYYYA